MHWWGWPVFFYVQVNKNVCVGSRLRLPRSFLIVWFTLSLGILHFIWMPPLVWYRARSFCHRLHASICLVFLTSYNIEYFFSSSSSLSRYLSTYISIFLPLVVDASVTSLAFLSGVQSIQGFLRIRNCVGLTNLNDLSSLTTITGTANLGLFIWNNALITNLIVRWDAEKI